MQKLFGFIQSLVTDHPLVRLMGICWGHQAIAQALGGEVAENGKGWELGVYDVELNEEGEEVWGYTKWDLEDERGGQLQEVGNEDGEDDDGVKRMVSGEAIHVETRGCLSSSISRLTPPSVSNKFTKTKSSQCRTQ